MDKFNSFMEEKFMPVASKISSQRHLLALRDGLVVSMPLMIVGSIFVILNEFPSQAYQDFMVIFLEKRGLVLFGRQYFQQLQI